MRWPQRRQTARNLHVVDLVDHPGPAGRAATARRLFRGGWGGVGRARAPEATGILAVEQRAVLSRIGDVVAHAGEPLERIHRLEVTAQGRLHPRAVEHRLLAVEVDELPEREGVADQVGGGVLETQLVRGHDRLAHVGGKAGMSLGEELFDQLGRDGALVEQAAEQPLAKQPERPSTLADIEISMCTWSGIR